MAFEAYDTFESVKHRLGEIIDAVNDESLPLEEALALYEEAVGLGLRASDLLEEGIEDHRADEAKTDEQVSDGAILADDSTSAGVLASADADDSSVVSSDAAPELDNVASA